VRPTEPESEVSTHERTSAGAGRGVRALVTIATGTIGVQAMALVTGVITARLLGVEGRGQIALIVAASTLVARMTLGGGLPVAITQLVARDHLNARSALRPFLGRWMLLALGFSALAGLYVQWTLRDTASDVRLGLAVGVVALTFQVIVSGLIAGALQGELADASKLVRGAFLLQAPFFVLVTSVYVLDVPITPVGLTAIQVASSALGIVLVWRLLRKPAPTGRLDRAELRSVARANHINAVGSIGSIGLDRNLVGPLLGTAALGLYAAAATVATMCSIVGNAVAMLLLPRLSAAHDRPEDQRRMLRQWLPATALIMLLLVGSVQLIVDPVIRGAFGTEFAPAIETARWLLIADGFLGFRRVLNAVLQARVQGRVASRIELALTGALVVGVLLAALAESLVLVAVAMTAAGVLSCLAQSIAIIKGPAEISRRRTEARTRPKHRAAR
jgi:enterobacterial common antigen flippase